MFSRLFSSLPSSSFSGFSLFRSYMFGNATIPRLQSRHFASKHNKGHYMGPSGPLQESHHHPHIYDPWHPFGPDKDIWGVSKLRSKMYGDSWTFSSYLFTALSTILLVGGHYYYGPKDYSIYAKAQQREIDRRKTIHEQVEIFNDRLYPAEEFDENAPFYFPRSYQYMTYRDPADLALLKETPISPPRGSYDQKEKWQRIADLADCTYGDEKYVDAVVRGKVPPPKKPRKVHHHHEEDHSHH